MKEILLDLHVQPRASKNELQGLHGGRVKIRVTASPVDGKANEEIARYLSELFGISRRQVDLVSGQTSRIKRFRIRYEAEIPPQLTALGVGSR